MICFEIEKRNPRERERERENLLALIPRNKLSNKRNEKELKVKRIYLILFVWIRIVFLSFLFFIHVAVVFAHCHYCVLLHLLQAICKMARTMNAVKRRCRHTDDRSTSKHQKQLTESIRCCCFPESK